MSKAKKQRRAGAAYTRFALIAAASTAVLLILMNVVVYHADLRSDLTSNQRFSVTDAGVRILQDFESPLNLSYYVSVERPAERASLERDVVQRLSAISSAVGEAHVNFDAARDLHYVDESNELDVRKLGVQIVQEQLSSGVTVAYYSSLVINYAEAPLPVVIPVKSAISLEYDLISKAVRLARLKRMPASSSEVFRSLDRQWRITASYAVPGSAPADSNLRRNAESIGRILNTIHEFGRDDDERAELQKRFVIDDVITDATRKDFLTLDGGGDLRIMVKDQERGGQSALSFNFASIRTEGPAEIILSNVAAAAWSLRHKSMSVGVFRSAQARGELALIEQVLYADPKRAKVLPEDNIQRMINSLNFITEDARVSSASQIPLDALGALVMVRPHDITPSVAHELQHFLASGGKLLVFAGDWHIPLLDDGLGANKNAQSLNEFFMHGEQHGVLSAWRVRQPISNLLSEYGVGFEPGILLEEEGAEYNVYGPQERTEDTLYLDPLRVQGTLGLIPRAQAENAALVSEVPALPLRSGQPILLDSEKLDAHGLKAQVILRARPGTSYLPMPKDEARVSIKYSVKTSDGAEAILGSAAVGELEDASNRPVGVVLRGQFPFDPNVDGPPNEKGEYALALGDKFKGAPGELIVISSPDLMEGIDLLGWQPGSGDAVSGKGLVEGFGSPIYQSVQQLVSNVLDASLFGEDVIAVRQSQLPPPRKVEPWRESERTFWTLLCVLMLPLLSIGLGSAWNARRKSLREKALG